jgi:hypothetical protein
MPKHLRAEHSLAAAAEKSPDEARETTQTDDELGAPVGRTAGRLLAGAALLSTTALLPAFETKIPPHRAD